MQKENRDKRKFTAFWSAAFEVGFIIFLFYSNLLMGEYTHSGLGQKKGLLWAVEDIFTLRNFIIGIVLAIIGHLFFTFLKRRV